MIAAQRRSESSFDSAACGLAVCASDGSLMHVNKTLAMWLGGDPCATSQTTFVRLLTPASALLYEMHLKPRLALGQRIDGAFVTLKSRHERTIPVVLNAVQDADGRVDIAVVNVREREEYEESIRRAHAETESARAQLADTLRALRSSEALVRAQFDASPMPTFVWQRLADGRFVLSNHNESALHLASDARKLASITVAGAFAEHPEVADAMQGALDDLAVTELELPPNARVLGAGRTLLMTVGPLPSDRVIMHVRDVTQERLAQQQQLHGHKMLALGQLVAGVAHEFNNVLAVIQGNLELVREDVAHVLPESPALQQDLEIVQDATRRAVSLVRQLLSFGGRHEPRDTIVELNSVVRATERLLRPILTTSIELHVELSESAQDVYADADTLSQVVTNLVINARDAVVERGPTARIGIHTSQVLLDTPQHGLEPGCYACVAVKDNGCGMSPEVQERAFEPFFTTKRVGSGTGLGLSMIYGVARDHGGAVTIESDPGHGTCVSVLLPRVVPHGT